MLDKAQRVKLAKPRRDGSVSLERCVQQRRSVRSFREQVLTKDELGQLLWAAQGVTGPEAERAVPSAGALYPLETVCRCRKRRLDNGWCLSLPYRSPRAAFGSNRISALEFRRGSTRSRLDLGGVSIHLHRSGF